MNSCNKNRCRRRAALLVRSWSRETFSGRRIEVISHLCRYCAGDLYLSGAGGFSSTPLRAA